MSENEISEHCGVCRELEASPVKAEREREREREYSLLRFSEGHGPDDLTMQYNNTKSEIKYNTTIMQDRTKQSE